MDDEFVDRLQILVKEFSGNVYSRFGKMIDVSPTTMQRYLEGRAQPKYKNIRRICVVCGVTPNWLLLGWAPKYGGEKPAARDIRVVDVANAGNIESSDYVSAPVLNQLAWREYERGILPVTPETTEDFAVVSAGLGGRLCAVRAPDDAMAPEIECGDLLVIDISQKEPAQLEGRIVFAAEAGRGGPCLLVSGLLFAGDVQRRPPLRAIRRRIVGAVVQIRRDKIGKLPAQLVPPSCPNGNTN